MVASATGTTITSRCLISHSSATTAARMTNSRHDQAATLRTNGVTASSATGSSAMLGSVMRRAPATGDVDTTCAVTL